MDWQLRHLWKLYLYLGGRRPRRLCLRPHRHWVPVEARCQQHLHPPGWYVPQGRPCLDTGGSRKTSTHFRHHQSLQSVRLQLRQLKGKDQVCQSCSERPFTVLRYGRRRFWRLVLRLSRPLKLIFNFFLLASRHSFVFLLHFKLFLSGVCMIP